MFGKDIGRIFIIGIKRFAKSNSSINMLLKNFLIFYGEFFNLGKT